MKKTLLLNLSLLYSCLVGCGSDDSGCTDWSSHQDKTLTAVPSLHEKSANISDDVLPLKLQMSDPSNLGIGSSTRSGLNLSVSIAATKDVEQTRNFNDQNLAFKGDILIVKNAANEEIYREGFPFDGRVAGWSFADDVLVFDAANSSSRETTLLDLRTEPPTKHSVPALSPYTTSLRFLNDGRYTLSDSSGLKLYSNQFEHQKSYVSTVNARDLGENQGSESDILLVESDSASHETNRWATTKSGYEYVPSTYCMSRDGTEITASSTSQLNINSGTFSSVDYYSNICSRESALATENATHHFTASIDSGTEKWAVEVKITLKSHDFENQKFNWDCSEKNFIIGEMAYDYEINMTNSEGEYAREHGTATFKMDKPTCTGSYSGG